MKQKKQEVEGLYYGIVGLYTPTVKTVTKTGIERPIPVKSRLESRGSFAKGAL